MQPSVWQRLLPPWRIQCRHAAPRLHHRTLAGSVAHPSRSERRRFGMGTADASKRVAPPGGLPRAAVAACVWPCLMLLKASLAACLGSGRVTRLWARHMGCLGVVNRLPALSRCPPRSFFHGFPWRFTQITIVRAISRLAEALRPIPLRAPLARSHNYVRAAPTGAPKAADTNSSSNGSTRLPELKSGEEFREAIVSAMPYFTANAICFANTADRN